jgi:CCR4-NOT transcription complex subunit 6
VEKQLLEFNQLALQRPDFQKTEDMFNRVFTKDNIAVVALLENRHTGSRLIVANVHIHWDPEYRDVKLVQTGLLMDQLSEIADRFSRLPPRLHDENDPDSLGRPPPPSYSDGTQIPTIVCGDFNSVPDSGVYEFMSTGSVPSTHPDFTPYVYGNYTSNGLKHPLALRSAYSSVGELPITNYTPSFEGAIDYIWYTTNTLGVNAVLGEVDAGYLSKVVGFPNAHFPSEYVTLFLFIFMTMLTIHYFYDSHICIMSEFRVKHQKDSSAQSAVVRKPPVFTNNSRTR